jgi:excinuclease ABC subunit A
MHSLRDKGNTLVVVEHEQAVMTAADHLIDLGPGAGQHGGNIIYQGSVAIPAPVSKGKIKSHQSSIINQIQPGTTPWLTGEKSIPVPATRRKPTKQVLSIKGATRHNLKKLDADIPLGLFVCLTGVSGSGKSTFAHDVLYLNLARKLGQETEGDPAPIRELKGSHHLSAVELVDQSAVARTPRSTPAVFLGAFDPIRQLFCETESANPPVSNPASSPSTPATAAATAAPATVSKKSKCSSSPTSTSPARTATAALQILHPRITPSKENPSPTSSISPPTKPLLSSQGALASRHPSAKLRKQIIQLLHPLTEVGLGYLKLGQPLNTLSGGESQRLKLCQLLTVAGTISCGSVPARRRDNLSLQNS